MSLSSNLDLIYWANTVNARLNAVPEGLATKLSASLPTDLCTDTREIKSGHVYVPLVGECFDGHTFLTQAFEAGAHLALCNASYFEQHKATLQAYPLFIVEDTLKAFQSIARDWRRLCQATVVGITGSSGKTSTKEILKQLFAFNNKVHATPANWNNEIGVPKTLLGLTPEHTLCLVEMGMRGEGQIRELCEIAEPDYGVITNIGPVHMGELGSQEAITRAKWELADFLLVQNGMRLVINAHNVLLQEKYRSLPVHQQAMIARVGYAEDCSLRIIDRTSQQRIQYKVSGQDVSGAFFLTLDLPGEHQALNSLCGVMLSYIMGQKLKSETVLKIPRLAGRQEEHALPGGGVIINDAYNANPDSMRAALSVLQQLPKPRVAVLGFMGELGPDSDTYHKELGNYCASLDLAYVIAVGEGAEGIVEGCPEQSAFFTDIDAASEALLKVLHRFSGANVLVKASRSARLERIVENTLKGVLK